MENKVLKTGEIYYYKVNEELYGAVRIAFHFAPDFDIAQNHYLNDKKESCYLVVETKYLSNTPPSLNDESLKEMLLLTHHSWNNDKCYWIVNGLPPAKFHFLGIIEFDEDDSLVQRPHWGDWNSFNGNQILKQHEWDTGNPEEILARERAEEMAKWEAKKKIETERKNRLSKLTLEEFSNTQPFDKWSKFERTKVIRDSANQLFKSAIEQVIALGEKKPKRKKMKICKEMIVGFNNLHKQHNCIETTERDDITKVLGDMFYVLKIKDDPAIFFEKWEDM